MYEAIGSSSIVYTYILQRQYFKCTLWL